MRRRREYVLILKHMAKEFVRRFPEQTEEEKEEKMNTWQLPHFCAILIFFSKYAGKGVPE